MKTINSFLKNLFFGTSIPESWHWPFPCTQDTSSENLDNAQELNAVEAKANATRPIKAKLNFDFDYFNTRLTSCHVSPIRGDCSF